MSALLVPLDERTRRQLEELSRTEGIGAEDVAARLLRRAVLRQRTRQVFDPEAVRRANAGFEEQDLALAGSDADARLKSLQAEDASREQARETGRGLDDGFRRPFRRLAVVEECVLDTLGI